MRWLIGPLVVALVSASSVPALASEAVPGGRYLDRVREKGVRLDVHFKLANDGNEFAEFSYVEIQVACPSGGSGGALSLNSDDFDQFTSVQVGAHGRFRYRRYSYGWIRGRFVHHGRLAVGAVFWPGSGPTESCPQTKFNFRARLVSRPHALRPGTTAAACDDVYVPRDGSSRRIEARYDVLDAGVGCTAARNVARRWNRSTPCAGLALGATCSLAGATCQSIRGGDFSSSALARCTATRSTDRLIELVRLQPCAIDRGPGGTTLWGINLACPAVKAFSLDQALERGSAAQCNGASPGAVRGDECARVAGFACTLKSDYYRGDRGRCVREDDPFQGLAYELVPDDP